MSSKSGVAIGLIIKVKGRGVSNPSVKGNRVCGLSYFKLKMHVNKMNSIVGSYFNGKKS